MAATTTSGVKFPIALKLILATVGLVAFIAIGFVTAGLIATQEEYAQAAERLKRQEMDALNARGLVISKTIANGLAPAILENDLSRAIDNIRQVGRGDPELVDALAVLPDWKILARTNEKLLGQPLAADIREHLAKLKGPKQLENLASLAGRAAIAFGSPIAVGNRNVGYLFLELSTARVQKALAEIEKERAAAMSSSILRTLLIGGLALAIGVLIAVLQGLRFSGAIRNLTLVAEEVGEGNLQARAKRTTNDEIGVLCDRFNDMTGRIDTLLRESIEKAALDKELERANAIQSLLMPPRALLSSAGIQYCGICEPASQMGGDWWHHYPLDDDRVLLCVGDVTGHGISSAMLTASAKAGCDTLLRTPGDLKLSSFLSALDYVIREAGKGELVMTLFAVLFDRKTMTIEAANAGHNFPFLLKGNKAKTLVAQGGRLGDGAEFKTTSLPVEPGDLLVLYSDGIIECTNEESQEFGIRRFKKLLQQRADEEILSLRDNVLGEAYRFYGDQPRDDDVTLVLCRF